MGREGMGRREGVSSARQTQPLTLLPRPALGCSLYSLLYLRLPMLVLTVDTTLPKKPKSQRHLLCDPSILAPDSEILSLPPPHTHTTYLPFSIHHVNWSQL